MELANRFQNDAHVQAVLECLRLVDASALHAAYLGCGSEAYPPERMLAIALYEILQGNSSPAKWCRHADTRDQCKLLGLGISPSRTAWYDFRDRAAKFIEDVHRQIISGMIEEGVVQAEECSLDGTFTRAAATRHYLPNLEGLNRRIDKLQQNMDSVGEIDLRTQAVEETPHWVARTSSGRLRQMERMNRAKEVLLQRHRENKAKPKKYQRASDKLLISISDPDAALGKDKEKIFGPIYNTQNMVDCHSNIIVSYGVWAQCNDTGTLIPMIKRTQDIVGDRLKQVDADSGYCSLLELRDCQKLGVNLMAPVQDATQNSKVAANGEPQLSQKKFRFSTDLQSCICPAGHEMPHRARGRKPRACGREAIEVRFGQLPSLCGTCSLAPKCLQANSKRRTVSRMEGQDELEVQKQKMESSKGKQSQRLRGQTVERTFADGKRYRNQNRQNGRGLKRVTAEAGLLIVAQNALTIYNLKKRPLSKPP